MGLLDIIKKPINAWNDRLNNNISGLFGEDPEKMDPNELRRLRRMAMAQIFGEIGRGGVATDGFNRFAQGAVADRDAREAKRKEQEKQAAAENNLLGLRQAAFNLSELPENVRAALPYMGQSEIEKVVAQFAKPKEQNFQIKTRRLGNGMLQDEVVDMNNPSAAAKPYGNPYRDPSTVRQPGALRTFKRNLGNGMVQDWAVDDQMQFIRPLSEPYPANAAADSGLNPRQQQGVNMTRDAALQYASNLTGVPIETLRTKSPAEVEKIVIERGGRLIQGGVARFTSGIPLIGEGIVNMANSDLIPPKVTGGSGMALINNPVGAIQAADQDIGEKQFPNALYRVEDQAAMLRRLLEQGSGGSGGGAVLRYDSNGNLQR